MCVKGGTDFQWKRLPGRAGSKVEIRVKASGGEGSCFIKVGHKGEIFREKARFQVGRLKENVENKRQYRFCLSD